MPIALIDPQTLADLQVASHSTQGEKCGNPENAGSAVSRCHLNAFESLARKRVPHNAHEPHNVFKSRSERNYVIHGTCELDSHADTCVAGPNCIIIEYTDQTAYVSEFS
jgi:hypothetical protein